MKLADIKPLFEISPDSISYPYTKKMKDYFTVYYFNADGIDYEARFDIFDKLSYIHNVKAYEHSGLSLDNFFNKFGNHYAFQFEKRDAPNLKISNTDGKQYRIFNTILKILKDFISHHKVLEIEFEADLSEPSRVSLYDKLTTKFNNYAGFSLFNTIKSGKFKIYQFTKNESMPLTESIQPLNIIEELTISDLNANTIKFPKKSRCRDLKTYLVNVQGLKFTPFQESNELWVTSSTQSSGHPNHYKTEIIFKDVSFIDDSEEGISFTGSDNEVHNIKPLLARINDCEVTCTCSDYKYRMQAANYSKDAGIFPAEVYVKKSTRPPINPQKIPFLCKHLLSMVNQLTQKRILRYT
jgi:hypothetical protein